MLAWRALSRQVLILDQSYTSCPLYPLDKSPLPIGVFWPGRVVGRKGHALEEAIKPRMLELLQMGHGDSVRPNDLPDLR